MPVVTQLASLLGKPVRSKGGALSLSANALVNLIVREDKKPDPPRIHPKGFIHVSSLIYGECPRAIALRYAHNAFQDERASGGKRVMWAIGRGAEKHVREQLIRSLPSHQVYGNWQCPCKFRKREGHSYDPIKCVRCGQPATEYVELDLESSAYFVTGHPDFILLLDGCIYPVEIKSINNSANANKKKQGFNTLEKPMVNHILQVSCYHRMLQPLAKKLGVPLGQQAIILYVCKDFDEFHHPYPYKQYNINPFEHKGTIQELFEDGKAAYLGSRGMLPPRLDVCTHSGAKCASACDMVHQCFAKQAKVAATGPSKVIILRD